MVQGLSVLATVLSGAWFEGENGITTKAA